VPDTPGGVVGVEVVAADGLEDALRRGDDAALVDRAPCGYLSTTSQGTITWVNTTFLTLTGYARDDLVGRRTFASLLTPGGRIYHETHYAPMLHGEGAVREIALDLVRADGTRCPVLVNSVLDPAEGERPAVVRTAVFDATYRRAYERELLAAKQRAEASDARARALARALQQTFIPPTAPVVPGLDVAGAYRPAGDGSEVGGDFYDVFQIADDDWAVAVGDVRGKGVEAAVVTALARSTLRGISVRLPEPCEGLRALNDALLHDESDRFCTVVLSRLRRRPPGWAMTLCCGGHPLPVLARSGQPPVALGRHGTLLGVLPEPALVDVEVPLHPGDVVVLYTDGVTEARRHGQDGVQPFYGEDRLRAAVAAAAAAGGGAGAVAAHLLDDVLSFQAGTARDDIALVVLAVPPTAPDDPDHPHPAGQENRGAR
jgi:phosphoserine phosphatase RsbU/P